MLTLYALLLVIRKLDDLLNLYTQYLKSYHQLKSCLKYFPIFSLNGNFVVTVDYYSLTMRVI